MTSLHAHFAARLRLLRVLMIVGIAVAPTIVQARSESYYQRLYCSGMELEHQLPSGGRVDCLSPEYAIEMDWAEKWAEAVGQSLYYARATERDPGIILLCPSSDIHAEGLCRSYLYRLADALSQIEGKVAVWECFVDSDRRLDDCLKPDLNE
mgnify:CR=1 FL=1